MGYENQACYAFGYPRLVKLLHVAINRQFNTIFQTNTKATREQTERH